ncbi:MAG: transposase [Gemmatimonadales bacterium]
MRQVRRSFSDEFKAEAVRQVMELGRPISQVARELSLRPEQIRDWKKKLMAQGTVAAPVRVETAEEEVRRLRRELAVLRQEHEFLGKAAAFFARGPARGTP